GPFPEPVLGVDKIQGNVLPGFMKDHQVLMFLSIDDLPLFRSWLSKHVGCIATMGQVLAFNNLFKSVRSKSGVEFHATTPWINIAFSAPGLRKLVGAAEVDKFRDAAFKQGL